MAVLPLINNHMKKLLCLVTVIAATAVLVTGCQKSLPAPTVKLTAVGADFTTFTFTAEATDADEIAYICLESDEEAPSVSQILAEGKTLDVSAGAVTEELTGLVSATSYKIYAAASNADAAMAGPAVLEFTTESDLFGNLGARDKAAILIVHFGTSHNDTRALTIDALNTAMREAFPGIEIREAWTSRIIIRKLTREGGIEKQNPTQALIRLHEEGYTHILVQSSNIIEGTEMKELRREVESLSLNFKDIRIGNPLLYAPEDYATVTRCLTEAVRKSCPNGQMLFVGHGTPDPATASYAMLDYMLKSEEHADCHVATVEGYPALGNALQLLKKNASRTVTLVPLMFVAGDHARNDIAGEWKTALEKATKPTSTSTV